MKGTFIIAFMLTSVPFIMAQDNIETQVKANMLEQETAWNTGDIEGFMLHYWNDSALKFVSKNGITLGWDKVLSNYQKAYPDKESMGMLVFELDEIRVLDNKHALVIGSWLLERNHLDELGGFFSLLWELKNDRWVITVDHTS